ncbi:hypothetical protein KUTeg_022306 [Tegillarca granosa]|uniref:Uncharacterized protein n=1 Tax=Tegillarca granosa TaxID=220873 RepID=A0ABQ9E674_TEGGR|nr:hypothetical protein KUTeg_022306 [Tegillarca granosa]
MCRTNLFVNLYLLVLKHPSNQNRTWSKSSISKLAMQHSNIVQNLVKFKAYCCIIIVFKLSYHSLKCTSVPLLQLNLLKDIHKFTGCFQMKKQSQSVNLIFACISLVKRSTLSVMAVEYKIQRIGLQAYNRNKDFNNADSCLPNPNGELAKVVNPHLTVEANALVKKCLMTPESAKRGNILYIHRPIVLKSVNTPVRMGLHQLSAIFKVKFPNLNESTVRTFRDKFMSEIKSRKRKLDFDNTDINVETLEPNKRGRQTLLSDDLDKKVQNYLKALRASGGVVTAAITLATGRRMVLGSDKHQLYEFVGHKKLGLFNFTTFRMGKTKG